MIDRSTIEKIEEMANEANRENPLFVIESVVPGAPPLGVMARNGDAVNLGEIVDLERFLPAPLRKRVAPEFSEAESFCAYVNDHKGAETTLFGSLAKGQFGAEIDYHGKTPAGKPSWCTHRAHLKLQPDPDWQRWTGSSGRNMSQVEFAEFLEDMEHTIDEPRAASIVEIVLKLQATSEHYFESAIDRDTGSATLNFKERTEQVAGQVKLPTQMTIAIRPYRSAKVVPVLVRIRYRVREGKVSFSFHLLRSDRIEEEAFNEIRDRIESLTSIRPLLTP